ncbi:MAG: PEP-CTERM sorting domain-containing protein [Microcystaceae cyanobacterium]
MNSVEQQQVPEPTSIIALLMVAGVGSLLTINQR